MYITTTDDRMIDRFDRNVPNSQVLANNVDPDQTAGLHCLPFRIHLLDALLYSKATVFEFLGWFNTVNFSGVLIFRIFMVDGHK